MGITIQYDIFPVSFPTSTTSGGMRDKHTQVPMTTS